MAKKLQFVGDFPTGDTLDEEEIKQIVDDYLANNPPTPQITINGEGPDENGNFVLNTSSEETTNMVEF